MRQKGPTSLAICQCKQPLIIAGCGPAGEHTQRAASKPRRTTAHGDDPVDTHSLGQIDRGPEARLRILAFCGIGMQEVTRGIHRR